MAATLTLGPALGDLVTEALGDLFTADQSAGDHEWDGYGAYFVYIFDQPLYLIDYDVTIDPGVYLRRVSGKTEHSWQVLAGDVDAYIEEMEAAWQAAQRGRCGECGAEPGEPCRSPGCQGDWD